MYFWFPKEEEEEEEDCTTERDLQRYVCVQLCLQASLSNLFPQSHCTIIKLLIATSNVLLSNTV